MHFWGKITIFTKFWHVDFDMDTSLLNFEHAMGHFEAASFGIVTSDYRYTVDNGPAAKVSLMWPVLKE